MTPTKSPPLVKAQALVAYRVWLPGRTHDKPGNLIAGKVVFLNGSRIFYREHPKASSVLRKNNGLGFDARIIADLMDSRDYAEYIDHVADDHLYRITVEEFNAYKVPLINSAAEGMQHYVDLRHWEDMGPPRYKPTYTTVFHEISGPFPSQEGPLL